MQVTGAWQLSLNSSKKEKINVMSVQYMGVTVQWRISWVHQVNIMSTLGDTLSSDTTAVCPFIITDKGI